MTNVKFKSSLIYLIQGEKTGLIKIGKTNVSIENRLNQIQALSPDKLIFLGGTFEPTYLEDRLHLRFERFREHGEWFQPNSEVMDFISTSCFQSLDSLYWAYFKVKAGDASYEDLIALNKETIDKIIESEIEESVKGLWKSDYFKVLK
ncbi:T5orf172 domain-containing protein [Sinobacterium caligoides]|uniref:T5orf172 domain-containing protein n=1 Tax=Sinobacterium caligoides TaxID=933926 RepID=A0A3N2DDN5_9GAMM|nr:GIY-YIG nuclease family protein [Sinobacterium caligoides]ROR97886.1 T5orf172 domain-containing protein [Sinobacterium caligoides]